jgi:hypothetical protein
LLADLTQLKSTKIKLIAFAPGFSEDLDFYVDFGDYLTLCSSDEVFDFEENPWFMPSLAQPQTKSPGTTLGRNAPAHIAPHIRRQ